MTSRIHRVTLFKVPKAEDQKKLIEQYKILLATNTKATEQDSRSQGFTVVSKTEFASIDDMRYFDDECKAHQDVKAFVAKSLTVEGVMTAYFTPGVSGGASP
ncbi:hypothetical protein CP533_3410 [Ophiocordyceps camponoti-saundersi (nom. inval.)]|nr:hypothetical protein CP533_3410 [Ophiocordyceps camponoti-saundersi (nom. inval.)]